MFLLLQRIPLSEAVKTTNSSARFGRKDTTCPKFGTLRSHLVSATLSIENEGEVAVLAQGGCFLNFHERSKFPRTPEPPG